MTIEKDEKITTLYKDKNINKKPFSLDKIQPKLGNHGDDIQDNLDNFAKLTEEIMEDINEETMEEVTKVDFNKK